MLERQFILAENQYYSMNDYETKANNNVLVVGTAGSGKTRHVAAPNVLHRLCREHGCRHFGQWIFGGGRFILPHSQTMIHEPLIPGGIGGSATSIRTISNSILETRDLINELLIQHTGKSMDEINKATSYDDFMNAEESVVFGICNRIGSPLE